MPILWTLHRYIFREMGKMFALAAIALTVVVGLGGGILNMMKLGEVTPGQVFRLMVMLLPLAAALTLPVAALFAATACYGRISADNEFVACRSSGINLHTLFIPAIVISLFSASVCFGFTNYLIPRMVRNLNEFVSADVVSMLQRLAKQPGGFSISRKYRMFTDDIIPDDSDPNRVSLLRVAFVEIDDEEWVRFGTARAARLAYEHRDSGLRVAARMEGVQYYDRRLRSFSELREQTLATEEFPLPVSNKIKFLNLTELLHFRRHPGEWIGVRREMDALRAAEVRMTMLRQLRQSLESGNSVRLAGDYAQYTISGTVVANAANPADITLTNATIEERRAGRARSIAAARAVVKTVGTDKPGNAAVIVEITDFSATSSGATIQSAKETLGPVPIPPSVLSEIEAMGDEALLATQSSSDTDPMSLLRTKARKTLERTGRKIAGAIHERLAMSLSVFVLVILGAALGIVFRGAHVLTAFGLSFIPALFIIITVVTGKQMAANDGTHMLGLSVIWGGLTVVAVLDGWVLTRVLRR